ncbi:hypothetical protein F5880DRAFT_1474233 [Lentinula raphanica]|nr:hypothetical protein F5880DRAFT_1474233 [Lentinula raphanica]
MEQDIAGGDHEPFWVGFPLTNIHDCIAPDILHQLYQGVLKHLVSWVQLLIRPKELDERIQKLPPTSGVRHFSKGISSLSQVSGTERKHIARILLACLVGKIDSRGITACRAILHFIQLAQYPSHDQDTLQYMEQELDTWHKNRDYFIDKEAREHFNIPKFHSLLHYIDSIQWIGATDNSNTEAFERLHIDFAKEGWRASNKRDHFPQMIAFVSRQEKISSFDFYQSWVQAPQEEQVLNSPIEQLIEEESQVSDDSSPVILSLSKTPSEPRKTLSSIAILHEAPGFLTSLKLFLNNFVPKKSPPATRNEIINGLIPFNTLEVWHSFGLTPLKVLDEPEKVIVKARPLSSSSSTPRYDTVIILENDKAESTAVQGSIGLSSCLWSLT